MAPKKKQPEERQVLRSVFLSDTMDNALKKLCFRRSQSRSEWFQDAVRAAHDRLSPHFLIGARTTTKAEPEDVLDEGIIDAGLQAMRSVVGSGADANEGAGKEYALLSERLTVMAILKECAPETLAYDRWADKTISAARQEAGDTNGEMTQKELIASLLTKIATLRDDLDDAVGFAVQAGTWARERHPDAARRIEEGLE